EERQEEDEQVDEDQEAPGAAGHRGQHVLEPHAAGYAEEDHREAGRSDQDEDHHGGEPHGALVAELDEIAQFLDPERLQANPANGEIGDRESDLEDQALRDEDAVGGADGGGDNPDHEDAPADAAELAIVDHGENDGADRTHRAGFSRCRKSEHHGAEHDEDQHGGGN